MCEIIFPHIFCFYSGISDFLCANVNTLKQERAIFTEHSAGNSVAVSLTKLALREIRADYRRPAEIHSRVYQVIKGRYRELVGQFGSEIVNNKQIALKATLGRILNKRRGSAELSKLKAREHIDSADIVNVVSTLDDPFGDGA